MRYATRLWPSFLEPRHLASSVGIAQASVRSPLTSSSPGLNSSSATTTKKMKRGTAPPAPHAPIPKRQYPRCGGARQRRLLCVATTTPQSWHGGAQGRRLLCVTLRHPSVGSRFSLKQPLEVSRGGTASARGFLSRWSLEPEGCLSSSPSPGSSHPWSCCRQASASIARRGGPVPASRRSRRTTALLHAPCSSKRAPVHPLRYGVRLAPVDSW